MNKWVLYTQPNYAHSTPTHLVIDFVQQKYGWMEDKIGSDSGTEIERA